MAAIYTGGTPDTILNRPLFTSSYVPAIALSKDDSIRRFQLLLGC